MVGDEYFAPGWIEYNHRLQYRQYDVTGLVKDTGKRNILGFVLANGWYRSRMARMNDNWVYGDRLRVSAFLVLVYQDGTQQVESTDDTWKCHAGEITKTDIYDGEFCDARLAQQGWSEAPFDDAQWSSSAHVEAPTAAQVFAPTASYLADVKSFFEKWLEDVQLSQSEEGGVACVVPDLRRSYGSSGWDDVITVLPTLLYKVW